MVATTGISPRRSWSTSTVDPQHALSYWVDMVCHWFLEIDIDAPERSHFRAQLDQLELGPATLFVLETDAQRVQRTRARIAHSPEAYYILIQLSRGEARFSQCGRESRLQPGECVLVDGKQPYEIDCLPTTRTIAVRFQQEWLKGWLPAAEDFAARPFRPTAGWSTALSLVLANLDTAACDQLALPPAVLAEQIAALLALTAGNAGQSSSGTAKLFARLKQTIRDRCMERDLSPGSVAEIHNISKRYLHHLFAKAGTTFGNELIKARLQSACRLLSDQRFRTLSLREIAARCGFAGASHFARRFQAAFGLGPSEYRDQHR